MFWFFWYHLLAILGTVGRRGDDRDDGDRFPIRMRLFIAIALVALSVVGKNMTHASFWIVWGLGFVMLVVLDVRLGVLRSRSRVLDHPETSAAPLDTVRAAVAIATLSFFVLLFMPSPVTM